MRFGNEHNMWVYCTYIIYICVYRMFIYLCSTTVYRALLLKLNSSWKTGTIVCIIYCM